MTYIKTGFLTLLFLVCLSASGQSDSVEMADVLRSNGKIYTVVAAVTIILTAVILLLVRVDRKITQVEGEVNRLKSRA